MLSKDNKKELDKHNQDKKAQNKPTHPRITKVHEQDHEEVNDTPDHPEPDLENHFHDIGNAYLEATTKEKLYIVAGPKFEEHIRRTY